MVGKRSFFFCKRLGAGVCSPFNPIVHSEKQKNKKGYIVLVLGQGKMVGFCENTQRVLNGGDDWRVPRSHDGKWRQEKKKS